VSFDTISTVNPFLESPAIFRRLLAAGLHASAPGDNDLEKTVAADTRKIETLVKRSGIKAD